VSTQGSGKKFVSKLSPAPVSSRSRGGRRDFGGGGLAGCVSWGQIPASPRVTETELKSVGVEYSARRGGGEDAKDSRDLALGSKLGQRFKNLLGCCGRDGRRELTPRGEASSRWSVSET